MTQLWEPSRLRDPQRRPSGDQERSPSLEQAAVLMDLLQAAPGASFELDARIDAFLAGSVFIAMTGVRRYRRRAAAWPHQLQHLEPPARWSADVTVLLKLVPGDQNFSLGARDGVLWSWIQPNDHWMPGPHEARHDHPAGSGLVVAHSVALALAAAIVALRARGTGGPGPGQGDG